MLVLSFVLEAHGNGSLSKNNRHNLKIVLDGTEPLAWSVAHSELSTFYNHPEKSESGFGWGVMKFLFAWIIRLILYQHGPQMTGEFSGHGGNRFLFDPAAIVHHPQIGLFGFDINANPSPRGLNQIAAKPRI